MQMVHSAFFVLFVLAFPSNQNVYERSTGLEIFPPSMTSFIGGTARFICSNLPPGSDQWNFKSITSPNLVIIYTSLFGLTPDFKHGGRHHVQLNSTVGTCSLAISNISRDDAGAYFCGTGHSAKFVDLVVIDSPPECKSNIDLSQVLVSNDCNIQPDLIDITCNLKFYGNIPPVLEWRHSNDSHVIRSNISSAASRELATSRMTIQPNFLMNGTHFICSVNDEKQFYCITPNISVMYFFNSTESRDISPEEAVNISCVANTSQHCDYKWQSANPSMEFHSQKLPTEIKNLDLKNIQCLADCKIRQQSCTVIPFVLNLKEFTLNTVPSYKDAVPTPAVVITILVVLIGVGLVTTYLLIRCCKKRRRLKELFPEEWVRGIIPDSKTTADDNSGVEQILFTNSVSYDRMSLKSAAVIWNGVDSFLDALKLRDEGRSSIEFKFDIPCHVQICYVHIDLSQVGSSPDVSVSFCVNENWLREKVNVTWQTRLEIPLRYFKRGVNWFKIHLNTGVYILNKITITYSYMLPDDITYMELKNATTAVLKAFDFRMGESSAIFKCITINKSVPPGERYAELSEPGQSSIMMNFDVPDYKSICRINFTLNHYRTSNDVILDIFVNNFPLRLMYSPTPRDIFGVEEFIIGKRFFKSGSNTVTIYLAAQSQGSYRLTRAVLEGFHIPKPCSLAGLVHSKSNTLVRDLVQLIRTRRQVSDTFLKIVRELEKLDQLTVKFKKNETPSEFFSCSFCLFGNALETISKETDTPITYVMEKDGAAVIRVGIDAMESNSDISGELNDMVEISEAEMYYDQEKSITKSVLSNTEQLLRLVKRLMSSEPHSPKDQDLVSMSDWLPEDLDGFLKEIKNFLISPFRHDSINEDVVESLNLTDSITQIIESHKKPMVVAGVLRRLIRQINKDSNSIDQLLHHRFEVMIENLMNILNKLSAKSLKSVLCLARNFHGFEGLDLSWINWLQHLKEGDFIDLENNVFLELWTKLMNCEIYDGTLIDIFIVSHGTIGAPEDVGYSFNAPFYHDVQQLLSTEVVFYAPWGVSIDHRVVASIVDGTADVKKCIIHDEPYANPAIKIPVAADEFNDRPDNWNILSRRVTTRNEAIPTVWLNGIDKTPHSPHWQNTIESLEDGHHKIFLTYRLDFPCPLPVITAIFSLFSAALKHMNIPVPPMQLHHAASLGWPNNPDDVPRKLQFIRQYHSSFSYSQQHGKRLWMTRRRDVDSNENLKIESNPDRSKEGDKLIESCSDDSTEFTYDTIPKDNATVWRVAIRGMTLINTRMYYVCSRKTMVEIYDVERSEKLDAIHVHQLESPWCLVKCRNNRFLYISELDNTDAAYVYKIDLRKIGKVHVFQTRFKVSNKFNNKWVRISVAENNNVIVCGFESSKIEIYNQKDIKIETVQLDSSVTHLQKAMLLNEKQIAFIHGRWREDKYHRLCIANRQSPQTIEKFYGRRRKDLNKPTDIVVSRSGLICVADFANNRVLVLNPDLSLKYKIRSKTNDKSNPVRLFIDDTEEYLYVGEDNGNISRLKLDQLLS